MVVVGGFLSVFYFYPDLFNFGDGDEEAISSNDNANTNTTNINTSPSINLNLSVRTGETEVNKSITYQDIIFKVMTADKKDNFESLTAEEYKTFIILYLDKINEKTAPEILPVVKNDVNLKSNENEYSVKTMNIAGANSADYATSYFIFEVNKDEGEFTLNFGAGDSLQTMEIGL